MMTFRVHIFLKVVLLLYSTCLVAARQRIDLHSYVNWPGRFFTFVLSTSVNPRELPSSKQRAEGLIHRLKNSVIPEGLSKFHFDQWGSFVLPKQVPRTGLKFDLYKTTQFATKDYVTFSPDMRRVQVSYSLPFSALTKSIERSSFDHIESLLVPSSSFNYTGIVVDATSQLPIKGREPRMGLLAPALLASLTSSDGRDLVTPGTVIDKFFKMWGTVAYSFDLEIEKWPLKRIGNKPIIVPGKAILGENQTTLEISDRYADMILSNQQGLQILFEGRILFLIHKDNKLT